MFVPVVYVSAMGVREEMSGCCRYVPGYEGLSKTSTVAAARERGTLLKRRTPRFGSGMYR